MEDKKIDESIKIACLKMMLFYRSRLLTSPENDLIICSCFCEKSVGMNQIMRLV